jgi:hypothetical protein
MRETSRARQTLTAAVAGMAAGLFFATAHYLFVQKEKQLDSNVLLHDIAWSFAEPVPASPEHLIEAIEKYHALLKFPFNKEVLTSTSPFTQMDIEYEYGVQKTSGDWEYKTVVVRVGDGTRALSYAEILWHLHAEAYKDLHDQDHHYFEGLAPKENSISADTPAYEVYLGS